VAELVTLDEVKEFRSKDKKAKKSDKKKGNR
jgi:hypothetical protein